MKSIIVLTLLFSMTSFAKTIARVIDSNGKAFNYLSKSNIVELDYGSKVKLGSFVMVEDGSSLSLKGDDGVIYHLSAGTFVKFYKDGVELKSGSIWVSLKDKMKKIVQTTNAKGKTISAGEYMATFDSRSGKSQFLTIIGKASFSNLTDESLKVLMHGGEFSYVSSEYNEGLPRKATRIGSESYVGAKQIFAQVKGVQNLKFGTAPKKLERKIASVQEVKKSNISFVEYSYKKKVKRKIASVKAKKIKKVKVAPVNVYKISYKRKVMKKRKPASVPSESIMRDLETVTVFEKSLQKTIEKNPRHKKEVSNLINELNSYSNDYEENY